LRTLKLRLHAYISLIKSLQTGLLVFTGMAGYMSARCPVTSWRTLMALMGSLFLAISGSTALNMVFDRDLDACMTRTAKRPLPSHRLSVLEALLFGVILSVAGFAWSVVLHPLYGALVFAGWFFDVVVYTMWLKRRTAWSVVWGGIAGGMPVLAGRTLAVGSLDWIGISFSLAILFWIPTHIMTFNLRHKQDYLRAGIPTFPGVYGDRPSRICIALSSAAAALAMSLTAVGIGLTWGYLRVLAVLSSGLLILAASSVLKPSSKLNFGLFKYASLYMLSSMLLFLVEML
jgi:protoheme IX farnesyltransferase